MRVARLGRGSSLRTQVLLGLVAGLGAWLFALGPAGRGLEQKGLDLLFLLRGALPPPEDLIVVAVDEPSFAELKLQWPWPRSVHAKLVERLSRAGARVIALDILFSEPSSPSEDAALADALARARTVVLASDLRVVETARVQQTLLVAPLPAFERAAAGVGIVNLAQDADGVIRGARLATKGFPSFAALVARAAGGQLPPPDVPFMINYPGPSPAVRTVSYAQALQPDGAPDEVFRGKIVFVGRAMGPAGRPVDDAHYTPFFLKGRRLTPGVEIHAAIVDTVLRRRPIETAGAAAHLGWALAWSLAAAVLAGRLSPWAGLAMTLGLVAMQGMLAVGAFSAAEYWIPWVGSAGAGGVVYGSTVALRWRQTERERAFIRRAFQHYVHPAVVQELLEQPDKLRPGGESVEATVLFSDLEGFTRIAEPLSPQELVALLNRYLSAMTDVILAHRGMLDQTMGDGILALWGVPVPTPAHALDACRAALAMQDRLATFNRELMADGHRPLRMRIGIQTGEVVAGNIGSPERFHYGVVGDTVNLASRLEGVNTLYATGVIVGDGTAHRVREVVLLRELDLIRVVGRDEPVRIFECVGLRGEQPEGLGALLTTFESGLEAYRARDWARALGEFERALAVAPGDGPSRVHLERSRQFLVEPPAEDWDGVYAARSKAG